MREIRTSGSVGAPEG